MRAFQGRRVLLGVTGGIAAYKAALLARLLAKAGAEVRVAMTAAATKFVGPLTFEALTGRSCLLDEDLFGRGGAVTHVAAAHEADLVVIAPATANTIAKLSNGLADNVLTSTLLASRAPVLLVPSMHTEMWGAKPTQDNLRRLDPARYRFVPPEVGDLASGDHGPGRFPEPADLVREAACLLSGGDLAGRTLVVTAGPTREHLDPVRVLTNPSTGRMGIALAQAALVRGASVRLVAGPVSVPLPRPLACGAGTLSVTRIETTRELLEAVRAALPGADALLMAAAPADERPAEPSTSKVRKDDLPALLRLEANPDILRTLRHALAGLVVLAFAAETDDVEASGAAKREAKDADLLFANPVGAGRGFGSTLNEGVLVGADGFRLDVPPCSKDDLADLLLDHVAARLPRRLGEA